MQNVMEKHLIIFKLGHEEYGIDISSVREIIKIAEIVKIPQSPAFVEGIIHLRENIIPIIDLARRLQITESMAPLKKKRILIVEFSDRLIGLVVDAVGEVLRISENLISPVPETVATHDTRYFQGTIKIDERIILFMDIHKVLNLEELKALANQT